MKQNLSLMLMAWVLLISNTSRAQFHVNREYQTVGGTPGITSFTNPAGVDWTATIEDASGYIITTGHTSVSGQGENMYIRKVSPTGSIIFQTNVNTSGANNDYGIAVTFDNSGNYYVAGTTDNGGSTNYDAKVWKFNSSGVPQFTLTYAGTSGLNDIGTGIYVDGSSSIFVCCSSESSSTSYNYALLKYSLSGSLQWGPVTYDYASLVDVPISVTVDGSVVSVMGSSASSLTKSDMAVARFNKTTGTYMSATRTAISGVGYDQAYNFKKDASQNIYLVGKCSTNGINYNMELVKIDPTYSIVWTRTVDVSGGEDIGTSVDVDLTGNVIMAGYTTKTGGLKQMSFYKYNSAGTLQYQYHQASKNGTSDAYVAAIRTSPSGQTYFVGGETGTTGYKEVVVGRLSASFDVNWERSIATTSDFKPAGITLKSDGTINVTTLGGTGTGSYYTTQYSEYLENNAVVNGSNGPYCKQSELIVRFLPSALNTAAINNQIGTKVAQYGNLSDFLTVTAYTTVTSALHSYCPGFVCDIKAIKIFRDLPTTYTKTVSRLGDTIPVRDFWATLLLVLPNGVSIQQARASLENLPSVVGYAHPNYVGVVHSVPNDSAYVGQKSLRPTLQYPNADVNMEEAWDVCPDGGRDWVKGGIFDTGLNWAHRDFGYNGSNANTSAVNGGWDFSTGMPIKQVNFGGDGFNHGTCVGGIINAIRNDNIGIAGICGNNYSTNQNPTNTGVKFYGYKINGGGFSIPTPPTITVALNYISEAIVTTAIAEQGITNAEGLNFMNNSWGFNADTTYGNFSFIDTNIVLLSEAVHAANRANVTFVASRGNYGPSYNNEINYPACYDDDWVINVGGTGKDGNYLHINNQYSGFPVNGEANLYFGNDLDIAAPGSDTIVTTLSSTGGYRRFNGTSASAAHVSGVVGLLMTYMNNPSGMPSYNNLAPEDCEFIIQKTASTADSAGYDRFSGHGRLNAGKAMRLIEKPYHTLYHFGTNSQSGTPVSRQKTLYSNSDTIKLIERYQNAAGTWFKKGKYIVKTYEITAYTNNNYSFPTDSVMYYWPRHSSSTVLELFNTSTKKLRPRERNVITFFNGSSANLKGYVYQVKDSTGTTNLGWWPFDTTMALCKFEYSVLVKNTAVGIKENKKSIEDKISVFPNPASQSQTILIEAEAGQNIKVEVFDIMGRLIKVVYNGKASSERVVITNDVGNLPPSLYIYKVQIGDKTASKRFIKG